MILGIDASRNRSGGAVAHLIGILTASNFTEFGITEVHIWSYKSLLDKLPDVEGLFKHNPDYLEKGILQQLFWQYFLFPGELSKNQCDIVFNTDAGTIGRFSPSVTMSQDMLSYEPGEMNRLTWGKERLRLLLLYFVQNKSLKNSDGVIFLTNYAANIIQGATGELSNIKIIPHGMHAIFQDIKHLKSWPSPGERDIRCIYVSNTALYKHQWHVVRAIDSLRKEGYPITLTLIGGGEGKAKNRLLEELRISDPNASFVYLQDFIRNEDIPDCLAQSDIFVFASSCENMPVTLIEGMVSGLPIACSDRGPMPEVLKNGGVYFDPENPNSISSAIKILVDNKEIREQSALLSPQIASEYSWKRCGDDTFDFITKTFLQLKK
ncbi:glycosyltransferase [Aquirufa nivalisilvae]